MVRSCGQRGAKQVVKLTAYIMKPHGEGARRLTFGTDIPERKQNATVRGEYAKCFLLSLSSAPPAGWAAAGVVPGARAPSAVQAWASASLLSGAGLVAAFSFHQLLIRANAWSGWRTRDSEDLPQQFPP